MSKDEIKGHLLHSIIGSEKVDTSNLNGKVHKAQKYGHSAVTIKEYNDIIRINKYNIIAISY